MPEYISKIKKTQVLDYRELLSERSYQKKDNYNIEPITRVNEIQYMVLGPQRPYPKQNESRTLKLKVQRQRFCNPFRHFLVLFVN